jgi:DNA polymerase III subunit delta
MAPDEAIRKVEGGDLQPVYLVVGEDQYLVEHVVRAIRETATKGSIVGLNEDRLVAGEADVDRVIGAAKMAPMMSKRRLVTVGSIERWESRQDDDAKETKETGDAADRAESPLDRLAEYAAAPVGTTCLVLSGKKIDGRRKIAVLARKGGWLVSCDPPAQNALPAWIAREVHARGHSIDHEAAALLAEIAGPELSYVADAIERLTLYVGEGKPVGEDAIAACVIRTRQSTVWELVGALGRRDLSAALTMLDRVYDPRDRGLRLIGVIAWSVRQLVKFDSATRAGASPEEAAKKAGAPPFKARELAAQVRGIPRGELERWLLLLSRTDLDLKGSRRPPKAIVEGMVMQMCARAKA